MRYPILACDSDGTLTRKGHLARRTEAALRRLRKAGGRILLVTGERQEDFQHLADTELFDLVVGENGGILYRPGEAEPRRLAEPPPAALIADLRRRKVDPLKVGRVMVATKEPAAEELRAALRAHAPGWQVIRNLQNLMALPRGVTKASGVAAALAELGVAPGQAVGVGNAENDACLLRYCGCGAAVADAEAELLAMADVITTAGGPAGLVELIDRMIADDLPERKSAARA
jgi:hydroxymethylpyrimidine pyrophosphatase-like HAD family hydrolase